MSRICLFCIGYISTLGIMDERRNSSTGFEVCSYNTLFGVLNNLTISKFWQNIFFGNLPHRLLLLQTRPLGFIWNLETTQKLHSAWLWNFLKNWLFYITMKNNKWILEGWQINRYNHWINITLVISSLNLQKYTFWNVCIRDNKVSKL